MKKFKEYLEEDPDDMETLDDDPYFPNGKKVISYSDDDAVTFGIVDNVLYFAPTENLYHYDLATAINRTVYDYNFDDMISMNMMPSDEFDFVSIGEPQFDEFKYRHLGEELARKSFDISGRLWTDFPAISFWNKFSEVQKYIYLIIKYLEEMNINPANVQYEFIDSNKIYTWSELGIDTPSTADKKSTADIERDQAKQHVVSPLLKKAKTNPPPMIRKGPLTKAGYQFSPAGNPILGDSVETFKNYFTETPDSLKLDGEKVSWFQEPAYPFGIIENVLYYSIRGIHGGLAGNVPKWKDEFVQTMEGDGKPYLLFVTMGVPKFNEETYARFRYYASGREDFDIAGRIWPEKLVISFWQEFQKCQRYLPLVVKYIESLKLNPADMRYEFIDSNKIYTWLELGIDQPSSKDVKSSSDVARDQAEQHVLSPLEKKPKTDPPPMIRRGKLVPKAGVQTTPSGRLNLDSVESFYKYFNR